VIDGPSGRLPEKDPRWVLSGTEACGGVKSVSWTVSRVSDFSGIYSAGIRSNGDGVGPRGTRERPGASWPTSSSSGPLPKLLMFFWSNKESPKSFTVFGLCLILIFCETKTGQKTATGTGH
jgi:hypothetical protein